MVPSLTYKIGEFVKTKDFPTPSKANMDYNLEEDEKVAKK
jgi:hypothetical protein